MDTTYFNDTTNGTVNDSVIMPDACSLALEILEDPQIAILPSSDIVKQEAIETCELACGGSCPSAAEQERALCQFNLTLKIVAITSLLKGDAVNAHPLDDFHHSKIVLSLIQSAVQTL